MLMLPSEKSLATFAGAITPIPLPQQQPSRSGVTAGATTHNTPRQGTVQTRGLILRCFPHRALLSSLLPRHRWKQKNSPGMLRRGRQVICIPSVAPSRCQLGAVGQQAREEQNKKEREGGERCSVSFNAVTLIPNWDSPAQRFNLVERSLWHSECSLHRSPSAPASPPSRPAGAKDESCPSFSSSP